MTGIAVYVEGGGAGAAGKSAIRVGMGAFLGEIRDAVRARGLRWKVVACGSREATYDAFAHALSADPDWLSVLLVDSERPVAAGTPAEHLARQDRWHFAPQHAGHAHLMAQVVETWFVADAPALQRYYGHGFQPGALPQRNDLEAVEKAVVLRSLQTASRNTAKEGYHKITDASRLLERIDPAAVRRRCPHCERLFTFFNGVLAEAARDEGR